MWDAQGGRKTTRRENKAKLVARDELKLAAMMQNNTTLQTRHENKIAIHYKLRNKPRICSMDALLVLSPPSPLSLPPLTCPVPLFPRRVT